MKMRKQQKKKVSKETTKAHSKRKELVEEKLKRARGGKRAEEMRGLE